MDYREQKRAEVWLAPMRGEPLAVNGWLERRKLKERGGVKLENMMVDLLLLWDTSTKDDLSEPKLTPMGNMGCSLYNANYYLLLWETYSSFYLNKTKLMNVERKR